VTSFGATEVHSSSVCLSGAEGGQNVFLQRMCPFATSGLLNSPSNNEDRLLRNVEINAVTSHNTAIFTALETSDPFTQKSFCSDVFCTFGCVRPCSLVHADYSEQHFALTAVTAVQRPFSNLVHIFSIYRSWLRSYARSRKVTSSIPDVITFFSWYNPSSRTTVKGLTPPLTEMSTRNLPGGVGGNGGRRVKMTPPNRQLQTGCLQNG
jgi:hypothetical protein